ncbi:MAG TPA: nitrilase-related carbon-nitrogen hydrolase, partial [Marinobacter sp.]|nr:nitrilase-related carbon-nitrogen hydrolase [Marinobacter sp.]
MSATGSRPESAHGARSLRVVMAQLDFLVGDIPGNTQRVMDAAHRAHQQHQADIVVFPELCLTGYPPEDLLLRPSLDLRVADALETLKQAALVPVVVIGAPLRSGGLLYNTAVVIEGGEILGTYFKRFPPNYQVFDEKRYFADGQDTLVLELRGVRVGITVCEDLWKDGPVEDAAKAGAQLILNLNASPFDTDKQDRRKALLERKARENQVSIVYANLMGGQDELVFDGGSMVYDHSGTLAMEAPQFEEG